MHRGARAHALAALVAALAAATTERAQKSRRQWLHGAAEGSEHILNAAAALKKGPALDRLGGAQELSPRRTMLLVVGNAPAGSVATTASTKSLR